MLRYCFGSCVQARVQGFTSDVQEFKLLHDSSLALSGYDQLLVIISRYGIVSPHDLTTFESLVKR